MKKFEESGVQIVGVSYDSVDILKRLADRKKIKFPLLSDKESKVIKAYGLLNKEAPRRIAGIPHPGTILIGKDGVVEAKLFVEGYRKRHTPTQLLAALKAQAEKKP